MWYGGKGEYKKGKILTKKWLDSWNNVMTVIVIVDWTINRITIYKHDTNSMYSLVNAEKFADRTTWAKREKQTKTLSEKKLINIDMNLRSGCLFLCKRELN